MQVVVEAQRLQRRLFQPLAKRRLAADSYAGLSDAVDAHEVGPAAGARAYAGCDSAGAAVGPVAGGSAIGPRRGGNDKRDQAAPPSPSPVSAICCSSATMSSPSTGSTAICFALKRSRIMGRSHAFAWRISR